MVPTYTTLLAGFIAVVNANLGKSTDSLNKNAESNKQKDFLKDPLSDEFIDAINKLNSTWKAGRNFPRDVSEEWLTNRLGAVFVNKSSLPTLRKYPTNVDLPDEFDARRKWSYCKDVIGKIRDQGCCGSYWAFGAVEAMSDRICIWSKGSRIVDLSPEDLAGCCSRCSPSGNGCQGGDPTEAWKYWTQYGIVSGGDYNSREGCRPYTVNHNCKAGTARLSCYRMCQNGADYQDDKYWGKESYFVESDEESIKNEIYHNGPVEVAFDVYDDFEHYRSGVYQHVQGPQLGDHAVKLIGWGSEDGTPYWLIANSWGTSFGDEGFVKFLRGYNHCNIESNVVAGTPSV